MQPSAPYKGLAVMDVVALAQTNQVPEPAAWTVAKHRQRWSIFLVSLVSAGLAKQSIGRHPGDCYT